MESWKYFVLLILALFHWCLVIGFVLYYPLTRTLGLVYKPLDILYMIGVVGIPLHWLLFRYECIVAYVEKKLLDKNYYMGKDPLWQPSLSLGFRADSRNPYMQLLLVIIWGMVAVNVAGVMADLFPMYQNIAVNGTAIAFVTFITTVIIVYYTL